MQDNGNKQSFEIFDYLKSLQRTNESNDIIDILVTERINEFNWKALKTDNKYFNQLWKFEDKLWQKLYQVSFNSLKENNDWGILILKIDGRLRLMPTRITNIKYDLFKEKIEELECYFDEIELKKSTLKCNLHFWNDDGKNKFEIILNDGNKNLPTNEDIQNQLSDYFGFSMNQNCIPFVMWKSNPFDRDIYSHPKNLAKYLEIDSQIILDQMFNSMTKKENANNDSGSGLEIDDGNSSFEKEYLGLMVNRIISADPSYQAANALYQPNDSIERFTKAYDWVFDKIKQWSNSIKEDDDDSAQKTRSEVWSINRIATSQLEIIKEQFEENIKDVIKIINKLNGLDLEIAPIVELPFNTVPASIIKSATQDINNSFTKGINKNDN